MSEQSSVLQSATNVTQQFVDWTATLAQGSQNILGILSAWNQAKNTSPVTYPTSVSLPQEKTVDDKLQKGFFYVGIGLLFVAGGIFLYKKI
jgi:hypothetical protein